MHSQVEQRIFHSRSFIDRHLSDPLNGEEIACHAHLSYFHYQHLFRQNTGESLWQYVKRLRLERAAFQLAFTSLPVADIAADCGFEATSSLSKAFRKQQHLSPQQYRIKKQRSRDIKTPAIDWNATSVRRMPPQAILSFRSQGLKQFPQGYFKWLELSRSMQAAQMELMGMSPDQPGVTAGDQIRWDTSVPAHAFPPAVHRELKELFLEETLPGGNYLVLPFSGFGTSFACRLPSLLGRLHKEGVQWRTSGRLFQILDQHAPDSRCSTRIYIPVP